MEKVRSGHMCHTFFTPDFAEMRNLELLNSSQALRPVQGII